MFHIITHVNYEDNRVVPSRFTGDIVKSEAMAQAICKDYHSRRGDVDSYLFSYVKI